MSESTSEMTEGEKVWWELLGQLKKFSPVPQAQVEDIPPKLRSWLLNQIFTAPPTMGAYGKAFRELGFPLPIKAKLGDYPVGSVGRLVVEFRRARDYKPPRTSD